MSYLLYVDDVALWAATSKDQAMELAAPYVREKRSVRISHAQPAGPPVQWVYDPFMANWQDAPERTD